MAFLQELYYRLFSLDRQALLHQLIIVHFNYFTIFFQVLRQKLHYCLFILIIIIFFLNIIDLLSLKIQFLIHWISSLIFLFPNFQFPVNLFLLSHLLEFIKFFILLKAYLNSVAFFSFFFSL